MFQICFSVDVCSCHSFPEVSGRSDRTFGAGLRSNISRFFVFFVTTLHMSEPLHV